MGEARGSGFGAVAEPHRMDGRDRARLLLVDETLLDRGDQGFRHCMPGTRTADEDRVAIAHERRCGGRREDLHTLTPEGIAGGAHPETYLSVSQILAIRKPTAARRVSISRD